MIAKTESGSEYDIDLANKRIRRVTNINGSAATARQGNNEWRTYAWISDVQVGHTIMIGWDPNTTPLLSGSPDHAIPGTETSRVIALC